MIILTMKLLLFLAVVSLENIVLAVPARHERDADQNSCENPDCFLYAAKLVAGIDWSTNPCDDFFQFACGQWIKKVDNPTKIYPVLDALHLQSDHLIRRVREILEIQLDDKEVALQKAQYMYRYCENAESHLDKNINFLKTIVDTLGGWKLGSSETVQKQDAVNLIANLAYFMDISVPFTVAGENVPDNISNHFVSIQQPEEKNLLTHLYSTLTAEEIVTISSHVFNVNDDDQAMKDAEKVLQMDSIFEQLIDNEGNQKTYFIDSPEINTETNWLSFLNTIFTNVKTFSPNDQMRLQPTSYFQNFFSHINDTQNAKAVYNYLMLYESIKYLRLIGDYLPSPLREISALRVGSLGSRKIECVNPVMKCFDVAIARKYGEVYHHIDKEVEMINELTQDILKEFSIRLNQLDWLDEPSKDEALKKLNNLIPYYEYPRWGMDLDQVNKHYESITSSGNYLGDTFQCDNLMRRTDLKRIIEPPRGHVKWGESPMDVNAYYKPSKNDIHILEGILDNPAFNVNRLRLMNYAGVGFFIGHEVTHGFDNYGVQFDEVGNYRPWLSKKSQEKFDERTQCLIDQYSSYKLTDLPGPITEYQVKGTLTLGENIADNGGLTLSYFSYHEWLKNNEPEILPDILKKNFTEEQAFFLSFARTWCVKYEHGIEKENLEDVHSPDKMRVNGPLSNFDKFAEAYNCPSGSPMARGENACHVW